MVYDLFDNVWYTVFFDDNVEAVRTAVKAGLFSVGVYDDASADYIEELKKISTKFVYNFSEMREISFLAYKKLCIWGNVGDTELATDETWEVAKII